jgi:hypothetical protein
MLPCIVSRQRHFAPYPDPLAQTRLTQKSPRVTPVGSHTCIMPSVQTLCFDNHPQTPVYPTQKSKKTEILPKGGFFGVRRLDAAFSVSNQEHDGLGITFRGNLGNPRHEKYRWLCYRHGCEPRGSLGHRQQRHRRPSHYNRRRLRAGKFFFRHADGYQRFHQHNERPSIHFADALFEIFDHARGLRSNVPGSEAVSYSRSRVRESATNAVLNHRVDR